MKYKVLVFDIDGTLTNSKKEITPATKAAIERASRAGCTIAIASGRPYPGTVRYAAELNFADNDGYVLALNGGLIVRCRDEKVMNSELLSPEYYEEIIRIAAENNVNIMTYDGDVVVSETIDDRYIDLEMRINGIKGKKVDNLLEYLDYSVPKFIMTGDGDYLAEVEKRVKKQLGDRMDVYRSEAFFLEILPKGVDKATAIEKLLLMLGCTREELICFGDGYNDMTMLEYAGMGVAMGNAKDEVKAVADYITSGNDEDGIVEVIDKFVLD